MIFVPSVPLYLPTYLGQMLGGNVGANVWKHIICQEVEKESGL